MIYIALALIIADVALIGLLWYHHKDTSGSHPKTETHHRPGVYISPDGVPLTICSTCDSAWPCDKV